VDIGIALWSHPDSGYLMSPRLCNRLADIETVVAIKYSVPRPMYAELTRLGGGPDHRLDRVRGGVARQHPGTGLAALSVFLPALPDPDRARPADAGLYRSGLFRPAADAARALRDSLDPVRAALKRHGPAEKPHAHQKYWQDLLGQTGGRTRPPMLDLTDREKARTREAFDSCGLIV
jgi:4-hydroxy-tetrahydrodipicolinate synthase